MIILYWRRALLPPQIRIIRTLRLAGEPKTVLDYSPGWQAHYYEPNKESFWKIKYSLFISPHQNINFFLSFTYNLGYVRHRPYYLTLPIKTIRTKWNGITIAIHAYGDCYYYENSTKLVGLTTGDWCQKLIILFYYRIFSFFFTFIDIFLF